MSKDKIADLLDQFQDYLSISDPIADTFRWLGWTFLKGLSWIVNKFSDIVDNVLFVKSFYQNEEVVDFVTTMRPLLVILLAFSILYTGYLLIFQKKFNREGIIINLFVTLSILTLLSTAMNKADEFTDEAVDFLNTGSIYGEEEYLGDGILHRNITDLVEFDKEEWESTDLEQNISISPNQVKMINIKSIYNKDIDGLSKTGKELSKYKYELNNQGEFALKKFDQSGLKFNNEYYYRYSINWLNAIATLAIIAFTLFSISFKLAKLFFSLTFNYVLATIIAPLDIHDGQKTKKVLTSIFNIFATTILIFLSMRIYIAGTSWIADELSNVTYIIVLLAFSLAVIDGPNIVEKLFGIDAGLKSGLGLAVGAYGGAKIGAAGIGMIKNSVSKSNHSAKNTQAPKSPNKKETHNQNNNGNHSQNNLMKSDQKASNSVYSNNKQKSEQKVNVPSPNSKERNHTKNSTTQTHGQSNNFSSKSNEIERPVQNNQTTRDNQAADNTKTMQPNHTKSDSSSTEIKRNSHVNPKINQSIHELMGSNHDKSRKRPLRYSTSNKNAEKSIYNNRK